MSKQNDDSDITVNEIRNLVSEMATIMISYEKSMALLDERIIELEKEKLEKGKLEKEKLEKENKKDWT